MPHATAPAGSMTIRLARDADAGAVASLAALDESPAPTGEVLLAELDGRPVAAVAVATGHTVADPFVATAAVADVLRIRAAQLRAPAAPRSSLLRLARLRAASG